MRKYRIKEKRLRVRRPIGSKPITSGGASRRKTVPLLSLGKPERKVAKGSWRETDAPSAVMGVTEDRRPHGLCVFLSSSPETDRRILNHREKRGSRRRSDYLGTYIKHLFKAVL